MGNDLHDRVLTFLETYRAFNPDFVYWLRERNTRNRLADGYWFQGNNDYAFVGLYDRGGGSNMTRSIGLVFWEEDEEHLGCYLEIVFNEENDQKIISFYNELMQLLGGFEKISETKYRKNFPGGGEQSATDFLSQSKPQIDELIRKMQLDNLFIDKESFDQKLRNIVSLKEKQKSRLFPPGKIGELRRRYDAFRQDPFFQQRIKQLAFLPFARQIIRGSLEGLLTNETFTGLIQILKNGSKSETVNYYTDQNISNIKLRASLKKQFADFGFTGYTGAGKTGINGLDIRQLEAVKEFILDCSVITTKEEAVKRVEKFDELKIPQIKCGVYSPWLYYLNPAVFPIKNNSHDGFIEWCNQPVSSYPLAILLFHEVAEILGEKDLGLIDAFTHMFSDEADHEKDFALNNKQSTMALNIILYGPPGTGKTYNTINKAVAVANPEFDMDSASRERVREEYERLLKDGQIEFITFHQSMSYEDFIEGIKPVEPKEGDDFLKYEIKDGLFKRLCERAGKVSEAKSADFSISEEEFQRASFYKISLGDTSNSDDDQIYEWCIKNGYMALGWGDANDFTGMKESDIQQQVPGKLEKFAAQAVNYFIHYAKPGDYVIVSYGNLQFRAVGKIVGNYEYKNVEGLQVHQFRKVDWLWTDSELPYEEIYDRQFSQQSIYKMDKRGIKKEFFTTKKGVVSVSDAKSKNYVLIIDEINRGNVSQIFGELITLVEEDKRIGNKEALFVTLPYSKKTFAVPPNLFIIGTMNTADRSVEALDTALRRRFNFEIQLPDVSKITESPNGLDLPQMLSVINRRLETLLNKDHTIGHAWLMNISTLEQLQLAFKNKILPLLQEFFYNDYAKIGLVLGSAFVKTETVKGNLFTKFTEGDELAGEYANKIIYTLKDPFEITAEGFKSIYE